MSELSKDDQFHDYLALENTEKITVWKVLSNQHSTHITEAHAQVMTMALNSKMQNKKCTNA